MEKKAKINKVYALLYLVSIVFGFIYTLILLRMNIQSILLFYTFVALVIILPLVVSLNEAYNCYREKGEDSKLSISIIGNTVIILIIGLRYLRLMTLNGILETVVVMITFVLINMIFLHLFIFNKELTKNKKTILIIASYVVIIVFILLMTILSYDYGAI